MPAVAEHSTTADRSGSAVVDIDVVIVGAGFSGLGMACNLKQAGYDDFVVLEKADEVGGTWRENTYPNCACDVPSNLYSFSFAPKADWPHTYSRQPAIQQYLRDTADLFGLREHTRFGCEFLDAGWDDETMAWEVQTSDGPVCARVLVAAMGPLHIPSVPDLPGIEQFEGTAFPCAKWDDEADLQGPTVARAVNGDPAI
ncbi:MAG: flavin-containing monooxygenase, partial [Solirubrobacterales bacterium]